jgi:hypothetical protein
MRYLKLYKGKILLAMLIVVFVVVGTLTKGRTSVIATSLAGVLLIYLAGTILLYIIKSPAKKSKDSGL